MDNRASKLQENHLKERKLPQPFLHLNSPFSRDEWVRYHGISTRQRPMSGGLRTLLRSDSLSCHVGRVNELGRDRCECYHRNYR